MTHLRIYSFFFLFIFLANGGLFSNDLKAQVEKGLQNLLKTHQAIRDIHPFLEHLHPIAVVDGDSLQIYDAPEGSQSYQFQKTIAAPFPMPPVIHAAFPLAGNGNRTTCVVTPDVFDSQVGHAIIFHEMMHCQQVANGEYTLKKRLPLARISEAKQDWMWEINHAFPYEDSRFEEIYATYLAALQNKDSTAITESRQQLRQFLPPLDYQYMIWQEFKEGFARMIENRIRKHLNLPINHEGATSPFSRVSFYYSGEKMINHLAEKNPALLNNIEALFDSLYQFP